MKQGSERGERAEDLRDGDEGMDGSARRLFPGQSWVRGNDAACVTRVRWLYENENGGRTFFLLICRPCGRTWVWSGMLDAARMPRRLYRWLRWLGKELSMLGASVRRCRQLRRGRRTRYNLQTSTGALSVDPDTERQAKISGRCQSGDDGGDGGDG